MPLSISTIHSSRLKTITFQVYIVGIHLGNFTEKDEIIRLKFSQLLIDFINKGDPSPPHMHWSALRLHQLNYFSIDFDEQNNMPGMKYGYHAHEIAFWNQTIRRAGHGRKALKDEALLQSSTTADLVGIPSPDKYCTDARSKNLSTKDNSRGLIKKQFRTRSLELDSSVVAVQPNDTKPSLQNVDVVVWLLMLLSFFSTIIFSATCATFLVERSRIKEYERLD
ncbi:unnamed protein product [Anisakis simplex]|uniref:COesterase domain-containing protein n=1 Tax=Anisakis simplex TaxID=6269 RepID=A0A0M3J154_ANISI|nr:unnamed protein product [Anisakis simplex]